MFHIFLTLSLQYFVAVINGFMSNQGTYNTLSPRRCDSEQKYVRKSQNSRRFPHIITIKRKKKQPESPQNVNSTKNENEYSVSPPPNDFDNPAENNKPRTQRYNQICYGVSGY